MQKLFAIFIFVVFSISAFASTRAIVFDHGGVLTKVIDKTKVRAYLQKSFSFSDEEFLAAWKRWKESKMQIEDFFAGLAKEKNITLPSNWLFGLEEAMVKSIDLNPEMTMLIKKIKEKGYKVAIFSNVQKPLDSYLRNLGHYDGFDPVVLSSEIGCEKPDPIAYKILLQKLNLKSDEIIFIDDKIENVEGARSEGIESIHFKSVSDLKEELAKRKIL